MVISIVGLGLIGGSLAKDLRSNGFAEKLIGVDRHPKHCQMAQELGLVDEIADIEDACWEADIVVLAVPVGAIAQLLPPMLYMIRPEGMIIDMGSTKAEIANVINQHPRRSRCVLAHPMAGTEYSGPQSAIDHLFHSKVAIICDSEQTDPEVLSTAIRLFKSLFMRIIHMNAEAHDMHAAYVSHISHITSFVLSLTVLEKEKIESNIFNMASGGFASTVRLAKSSPQMWRDVYQQNSQHILDVLDSYIEKMQMFREHIAKGEFDKTFELMEAANQIRKILDQKETVNS